MATKVEAYKSKDGRVFATEEEAMRQEFASMLEIASDGTSFPSSLVNSLWENRDVIRDFLAAVPKKAK